MSKERVLKRTPIKRRDGNFKRVFVDIPDWFFYHLDKLYNMELKVTPEGKKRDFQTFISDSIVNIIKEKYKEVKDDY